MQGLEHLSEVRVMQARLAGDAAPQIAILAGILEPMKGYTRHRSRNYGSATPFNRLVDAIPPESETARQFRNEADRVLSGADAGGIRKQLAMWRENARMLAPKLASNPLLAEVVEVAATVEELCAFGLEALESHPDASRIRAMLAAIDHDSAPNAEMLIQIAPAIRKIVQARSN